MFIVSLCKTQHQCCSSAFHLLSCIWSLKIAPQSLVMWGIIHICSTNSELNFTLQNMINNSLEKNLHLSILCIWVLWLMISFEYAQFYSETQTEQRYALWSRWWFIWCSYDACNVNQWDLSNSAAGTDIKLSKYQFHQSISPIIG